MSSARDPGEQQPSGDIEIPTVSTTLSPTTLQNNSLLAVKKEKRENFKPESLPTDLVRYILGFGDNWDLLNVRYAIKSWSRDLAQPVQELQHICTMLAAMVTLAFL